MTSATGLVKVTDALGNISKTDYDGVGNQTATTDALGRKTTYVYDALNRLVSVTLPTIFDPLGLPLPSTSSMEYDPAGNVRKVHDALGRVTEYQYDPVNRRSLVIDALGDHTSYSYDKAGNLVAVVDPLGRKTVYVYDALNRLSKTLAPNPTISGLSDTTTVRTYDKAGNLLTLTDPLGRVTTYTYDKLNRLATIKDALGGVITNEYDAAGNRTASIDQLGRRTEYGYDALNRLATITEPAVNGVHPVTTYSYDTVGNRTGVKDQRGFTTTYAYDPIHRLTSTTDALTGVTSTGYDAVGNVLTTTDALGRTTQFAYDAQNHLVTATQLAPAAGVSQPVTSYVYDAVGNRTQVTDPLGRTSSVGYDALNRGASFTDALGNTASRVYDAAGRTVSTTDQLGRVTTYAYDFLDRLVSVTQPDPDGAGPLTAPVTTFTFDLVGNRTSTTDPRGNTEHDVYDALNRQVEIDDAYGNASKAGYDAVGNVVTRTDTRSQVTTFTYDALNRLVTVTAPDPDGLGPLASPVSTFAYDLVGDLVGETDPLGHTTSYVYDGLDRQTRRIDALGGIRQTTFDAVGNVIETIDELGNATFYAFDALNRLVRVTMPDLGTGAPVVQYAYDAVGNRTSQTDPLGRVTSFAYDALNRLVSTTDAAGGVATNTYDAVGNVLSTTDRLGRTTTFVYDALDRLIQRLQPDPDGTGPQLAPIERWAYDANGNLTRLTDADGNVTQYAYDKLNRRSETIDATGAATFFAYDGDGHLVSTIDALGRVTTYTYDGLGRGVTTTLPDPDGSGPASSPVVQFAYDAAGNLVSTTDALGHHTTFTYDALNRRSSVIDALGGVSSNAYDAAGDVVATTDQLGRVTTYVYDALRRLVSMSRPDPGGIGGPPVTSYTYDLDGNLLTTTDPLGRVTAFAYDVLNRVTTTTDALGDVSSVSYDAVGNVVATVDALGRETDFVYDRLNRRVKMTQPDPDGVAPQAAPVWVFSFDAVGNVVMATDPLGNVTTYAYDALNRRVTTTDALAGVTTVAYDAVGNVAATVDALGRTTTYLYDGLNRRVAEIQPDPDGSGPLLAPIIIYDYDLGGNLTQVTDPLGHATSFAYDALNRRIAVTDAIGGVSSVTYDAVGNVLTATDQLGRVTTMRYDALDRRVQVVSPDPDGAGPSAAPTVEYAYDLVGNLVSVTDPLGNVTGFQYDALNRRTAVVDALGHISSTIYDAVGNVTSTTDVLGRTTTSTYDALNRLVRMTLPGPDGAGPAAAPVSVFSYDADGNLLAATDADGNTTTYAYDALNRRTAVTDALHEVTATTYDAVGNVLTVTDPLGRKTTYGYDALDRRIRVTDQLGEATATAFDAVGNVVSTTDPLGNQWLSAYDALNRLVASRDADGNTTLYTYDAVGDTLTVTDALANTTTYTYDGLSRLMSERDQLGDTRQYAYDLDGRRVVTIDALGRTTRDVYDALGRNTGETWLDASSSVVNTITRTFDAAGQLHAVSDAFATYAIDYDALGRMTRIDNTGSPGLTAVVLSCAYDSVGNLLRVSSTIGGLADWATTYTYDALNRVVSVAQSGGEAVDKRVTFTFDAAGQVDTVNRFAAGATLSVTSTYTWDAAGRVAAIGHVNAGGSIDNLGFTWDAAGRLVGLTSVDGTATFSYDANGQLGTATYSYQPQESFTYDAAGNRVVTGAVTPTANRILDDGTYTYTYDAEGNRVTRTNKTTGTVDSYVWDQRNRLVGVTTRDAGGTVLASETYRYDAFGWKIVRVVDADGAGPGAAVTEQYVHDRDNIVMVLGATANQLFLDASGRDGLLAEQDGSQLHWLLGDEEQTVLDVTDAGGTLVDHLRYEAFGAVASQTNALAAPRFGYTGRELDTVSGLLDYRARWYDPALGRFLSVDPSGFAAGDPNLYRYVFNQPTRLVDPTGLSAKPFIDVHIDPGAQRDFAQWGDQIADVLVPGRALIPSGSDAGPWSGLARDLTNPALLAEEVAGGVIGVANSFAKVVTGAVDAVKWLASGQLGVMAADALEGISNRLNAACGDVFKAAATGIHDLAKLVAKIPDAAENAGKAWWQDVQNKTLSGDIVGASAQSAETAADVAQIVAPVAGAAVGKIKALAGIGEVAEGVAELDALTSAGRGAAADAAALESADEAAHAATRAEQLAAAAKSGDLEQLQKATQDVLELGKQRSAIAAELYERAGGVFDYSDIKLAVQNLGVQRYEETKALFASAQAARDAGAAEDAARLFGQYETEMRRAIDVERGVQGYLETITRGPWETIKAAVSSAVDAIGGIPRNVVNWAIEGPLSHLGLTERVSPILAEEMPAFAEAAAKLRAAESGVVGVEVQARKVTALTKSVLEFASEFNVPTKPAFLKAKTFFGLIPQDGLLSALANAPRQILGEGLSNLREGFGKWLSTNFFRGDVDLYEVTKVMENGERIGLTNSQTLRFGMDVNQALVDSGLVPTIQHGAHATLTIGESGFASFEAASKIGEAGQVATHAFEFEPAVATVARGAEVSPEIEAAYRAINEAESVAGLSVRSGPNLLDPRDIELLQNRGAPRLSPAEIADEVGQFAGRTAGSGNEIFASVEEGVALRVAHNRYFPETISQAIETATGQAAFDYVGFNRYYGGQFVKIGENTVFVQKIELFEGLVDSNKFGTITDPGLKVTKAHENAIDALGKQYQSVVGDFDFQYGRVTAGVNAGQFAIYDPVGLQLDQLKKVVATFPPRSLTPSVGAPLEAVLGARGGTTTAPGLENVSVPLALVGQALALWQRADPAVPPLQLRVAIADLPAGQLGAASITQLDASGRPSEGQIALDWNGDGAGWFVDPTPLDASEFSDPTSAAFGHYDLLSVIAHELGHALGFLDGYDGFDQHVVVAPDGSLSFQSSTVRAALTPDGSHLAGVPTDLMSDDLGLFERKLPSALSAAIVAQAQGSASSVSSVPVGGAALDGSGVVNGDFGVADATAAGFGWQTLGGASVANGQGVLSETPSLASRFCAAARPAEWRAARSSSRSSARTSTRPGLGPQDAFEVALLDPQSMQSLAGGIGLTDTDALLNLQADGTVSPRVDRPSRGGRRRCDAGQHRPRRAFRPARR